MRRKSLRCVSPLQLRMDSFPKKSPSLAPKTPQGSEVLRHRKSLKCVSEFKKVEYDGAEFEVGDDVYVKRREEESSDEDIAEFEECVMCFMGGRAIMIECEDCLGGFHIKCLKPPLKAVPEGSWICEYCESKRARPTHPSGKRRARTLREKLLSSDLYAAHIERIWKDTDGTYWFRGRWYIIPEETSSGRQPHNLKRELYITDDYDDIEMECIIRHCYVMTPEEYADANHEGDDVFLCEYGYGVHSHSFKRLADEDEEEMQSHDGDKTESDDDDFVGEGRYLGKSNRKKRRRFENQKSVGYMKRQRHKLENITDLEKAKELLLMTSFPKSHPCRNREMDEIASFLKGAICEDGCVGRSLYIHGVPGTGKTMCVRAVMKKLKSEVDKRIVPPYTLVEVNGLKLSSPENIYKVIYEGLNGHRIGWKKALQCLSERFTQKGKKKNDKPCILFIDELDVLVTRNQSVLYNILDWPTKTNSKLIVIGVANTMDLPEKLLPRIASRMGIERLCFSPYNHQQLHQIISSRLDGLNAFENPAIEFASRKVAAISGDARRALEICRRAAEIADQRVKTTTDPNAKKVAGMKDVEDAMQEMFQSPHIQIMKHQSKLAKIMLVAMVHEFYKSGVSETNFENLAKTVSNLCDGNGEVRPSWDTLLRVGCRLGESRIIICNGGAHHRLQKMQLNFPSDDVAFALKDCKELTWLSKYL